MLSNPSLVVAVGSLGHEVALRLERRAAEFADLAGPEAIRNLAVVRILSRRELLEARQSGLAKDAVGLHFAADDPDLARAFEDDKVPVAEGLDPASLAEPGSADVLLARIVRSEVARLFQVDRFVDFHPDRDPFVSRLDVYVVGGLGPTQPLAGQAHSAVLRALSATAAGPLAPLFRAQRSNLALLHLVAFPRVADDDGKTREQARTVVARYRADLGTVRHRIEGRFLFLEDRSAKYVLSPGQIASPLGVLLQFLLFGGPGRQHVSRDLIERVPDAERLRRPEATFNRLCGSFSAARFGTSPERLQAYCRNRQAIGMLLVFLGRPQDGQGAATVVEQPFTDADKLLAQFGPEGTIETDLARRTLGEAEKLEADRKKLEESKRVRDWGLRDLGEWEYHGDLVESFHDDLQGRGTPTYTHEWAENGGRKILRFMDEFVQAAVSQLFRTIDKQGEQIVTQLAKKLRTDLDAQIDAAPAGWKGALDLLARALAEVEKRISHYAQRTVGRRLRPVSPAVVRELIARQIHPCLAALREEVDLKPVRQRLLFAAGALGSVGGSAVGLGLTLGLPFTLAGIGLFVLPAAAGGCFLGLALARHENRRITDSLAAIVAANPGCRLQQAIDRVCDDLYLVTDERSYLGERIAWSFDLWRLRMWRRLHAELAKDVERLRDIGRVLEAQLARFRQAQEALGVRYRNDDGILCEDASRVLPEGDVFDVPMFPSDLLDELYAGYATDPARFADAYRSEKKPFEHWRADLPFAAHEQLEDFSRKPFDALCNADLLDHQVTKEAARTRLRAFLGDFANKLEIHGAFAAGEGRENGLIACHKDARDDVEKVQQELRWPGHWKLLPKLEAKNVVWVLRYVHELAPWGIESLPSQRELVGELIRLGRAAQLPAILDSMESTVGRVAMLAEAVPRLAASDLPLCRELLHRPLRLRADRDRPADGALYAPVAEAAGWLGKLAGTPGVLPLAAVLYGVAVDGQADPVGEAHRRASLLAVAAEGHAEWALRALLELPAEWISPLVRGYLEAGTVLDLLLQQRAEDALHVASGVAPPALRAATLLAAIVRLASGGERELVSRFLDAAPEPSMGPWERPPSIGPVPLEAAAQAVRPWGDHPALPALLAWVFGGRPADAADAAERARRVELLLSALPRTRGGELLLALDEFPAGAVDPNLVVALRARLQNGREA